MLNKLTYDTQSYADVQGLEQLRYASHANTALAKHEVAKQFQAYFFSLALKSMSEANKAMSGGLFGSDQMDFYDDMFNKQLSLQIANQDLGLTQLIEKNISIQYPSTNNNTGPKPTQLPFISSNSSKSTSGDTEEIQSIDEIKPNITSQKTEEKTSSVFTSPKEFIEKLWDHAKIAAEKLNIDPRILLAQAALETSWGKKIIPNQNDNVSSHNLFNIKADSAWKDKSTSAKALEEENGMLKQKSSKFRVYDSFKESFEDYVHFIKGNERYQQAVKQAHNALNYLKELQKAGFATDADYAKKIQHILTSDSFKSLINSVIKNI